MRVSIRKINQKEKERVIIECVEITPEIQDICSYTASKGEELSGITMDKRLERFSLTEVLYFEAVGEKVFAYTKEKEYELKKRLYELEHAYQDKFFVRCSKSLILNLMQLDSISPALNGRFHAYMKNGEKLIISRQYAPLLKTIVIGERNKNEK